MGKLEACIGEFQEMRGHGQEMIKAVLQGILSTGICQHDCVYSQKKHF